jgi:hypothetical protein
MKNLKKLNSEETGSVNGDKKALVDPKKKNSIESKRDSTKWIKWIFGSLMFVVSVGGLFYLFKNKNRFARKL